jgi:hypothetical protein
MNNELMGIWKELVVTEMEVSSRNSFEGLKKVTET